MGAGMLVLVLMLMQVRYAARCWDVDFVSIDWGRGEALE